MRRAEVSEKSRQLKLLDMYVCDEELCDKETPWAEKDRTPHPPNCLIWEERARCALFPAPTNARGYRICIDIAI